MQRFILSAVLWLMERRLLLLLFVDDMTERAFNHRCVFSTIKIFGCQDGDIVNAMRLFVHIACVGLPHNCETYSHRPTIHRRFDDVKRQPMQCNANGAAVLDNPHTLHYVRVPLRKPFNTPLIIDPTESTVNTTISRFAYI